MIFIVVKFKVKPDRADKWIDFVSDYTASTRAEPKNLWFDWSRSVEDSNEFVLVEAFEDDGAGPHVESDYFKRATVEWPDWLVETPSIVSTMIEGADGWSKMAEVTVE